MQSPGSILERATRRPGRFLALAVGVTAALVALELGLGEARSRHASPLGAARWIWDGALDLERAFPVDEPVAFYAVGEVELAARPAAAHLALAVDEEYVLWLNGTWIGANRYRDGNPADQYEVTRYLRPGRNRVVIEARSLRSAGGILCRLRDGEGRALLVSDGSWRVLTGGLAPLRRTRRPLPEGAPAARVWGRGDVGRWDVAPPVGPPRPTLGNRLFPARTVRTLDRDGRWRRWRSLHNPHREVELTGGMLLFDWGELVHGYVTLHLAEDAPPPAFVGYGTAPPSPEAPADQVMVAVPGARRWDGVALRRFRYLLVVGADLAAPPEVRAVGPNKLEDLAAPTVERQGVFGFAPPPGAAAEIEEEVRERVARERAAAGLATR